MLKIKHLFLVSSAINTKFGDFTTQARLRQTIGTINSIKERIPNAKVIIIESSGYKLEDDVLTQLRENSNVVIDFSGDAAVQHVYNCKMTVNGNFDWDIVKNTCEILSFYKSLEFISKESKTLLSNVDRIHKISGRYSLTNNFNPYLYEVEKNKIIILRKKFTQFTGEQFNGIVDIPYQYMTRLWSWPIQKYDTIYKFYEYAINEINARVASGRFADIEHLLYTFIDPADIFEVDPIGIKGILSARSDLEVDE